jgi:hypothetical protein
MPYSRDLLEGMIEAVKAGGAGEAAQRPKGSARMVRQRDTAPKPTGNGRRFWLPCPADRPRGQLAALPLPTVGFVTLASPSRLGDASGSILAHVLNTSRIECPGGRLSA